LQAAVTFEIKQSQKDKLAEVAGGRCKLHFFERPDDLWPLISEVDIIMGWADQKFFPKAASLKWMQASSAGVESYLDAMRAIDGAILTNASGAYGASVSEHMLAYVLMLFKHMPQYVRAQAQHDWHFYGKSRNVFDSVVTVVGLGDLGSSFAKKMSALGATVRGVKYAKSRKPDYLAELYAAEDIDEALKDADIVALCLPSTAGTRGIMSKERIFALKQDAVLLNAGRGDAVDQVALIEALRSKRIFAGLDVTTPEPLPKVHPLWELENLVLTPHIAGVHSAFDYAQRFVGELFARNLGAYLDGRPLENVVDLQRGY
jgi:phosphoglycerate dehydrogenase-like enzyme